MIKVRAALPILTDSLQCALHCRLCLHGPESVPSVALVKLRRLVTTHPKHGGTRAGIAKFNVMSLFGLLLSNSAGLRVSLLTMPRHVNKPSRAAPRLLALALAVLPADL